MDVKNIGFSSEYGLQEKLKLNRPLNVKLGFDPTSPDLHLGHWVVLKGAKALQDMGHNIIIIVGDFTASIGDPSGRNKLRPPLSSAEIIQNANTYTDQVFNVLDRAKTKIVFNGSWFDVMTVRDMVKLLSSVTVSQVLAREDFKTRLDSDVPVFIHEITYPLMQGFDSVKVSADVELGGTDQTFNLFMGRELQRVAGQPEQSVLTFPLLVGLDGIKKMSKSLGNHIGLTEEPVNMFGKTMSISDDAMWQWFKVLLNKTESEISDMKSSNVNPMNFKMDLASEITGVFHGKDVAIQELARFVARFKNKTITDVETVEVAIDGDFIVINQLIKRLGFATSVSDATRKIEQRGVKLNQELVLDKNTKINRDSEVLLQVGKLNIKKVKLC